MPVMIHDKPWLLIVFAAIGFAMTWLMMPRRDPVRPMRDSDAGHSSEPDPREPHRRRRWTNRFEEAVLRERQRRESRNTMDQEDTPPPPPPEWCVLLGVGPDIDRAGLRKAYVAAIKSVHPDCIGPDCPNVSETCAHLAEAYSHGREHISRRAVA